MHLYAALMLGDHDPLDEISLRRQSQPFGSRDVPACSLRFPLLCLQEMRKVNDLVLSL